MAPHADGTSSPTTTSPSALKPTAASFHPSSTPSNINTTSKTTTTSSTTAPTDSRYHSQSTTSAITTESQFAAHNYHPLPIVFSRAQGCKAWDPEGQSYIDCLSAYSAVNQGHCHPALVKALCDQASRLTLSSRAFHNDVFPKWAEKVQKVFGYDMVLPMNTGAEAVETAVKIARKWAYKVKGVEQGKAIVFAAAENFHGRTMTAISMSTDPESRDNYGPYVPSIGAICPSTKKTIRYGIISDIEEALAAHGKDTAAIILEPIQGEAGVVVPPAAYLPAVSALCKTHNVLLIIDEIQTGVARTGKMLCSEHAGIKPDLVTLGKAISGGMYPVSCVLGSREVMMVVEPGTHGSTYGGNPLGCAVSIRALEVVEEEGLVERARVGGEMFRKGLKDMKSPLIKLIRGMGLLNAIVIDESKTGGHSAWDICMLMKKKGLLAKPTHQNIIRLAPPLVISDSEIKDCLRIIKESLEEIVALKGPVEEAVIPASEKGVVVQQDE